MAKIGSNETFTESLDNTLIQLVLNLGCAVFPKNQKRHNLRANVVLKWQPIKVGSAKNPLILHNKEYRFFTLLTLPSCHIQACSTRKESHTSLESPKQSYLKQKKIWHGCTSATPFNALQVSQQSICYRYVMIPACLSPQIPSFCYFFQLFGMKYD